MAGKKCRAEVMLPGMMHTAVPIAMAWLAAHCIICSDKVVLWNQVAAVLLCCCMLLLREVQPGELVTYTTCLFHYCAAHTCSAAPPLQNTRS